MTDQLQFHALGPLEVAVDGTVLDLGPYKQRSLLALLVANANRVVSVDRIVDSLWGEDGEGKDKAVFVYISRLRSVLEPDRTGHGESSVLITRDPGYLLRTADDAVDLLRFEDNLELARETIATDPTTAVELLDSALSEWRGDPFADFAYESFAHNEIDRLEELRLEAMELRFEGKLELGQAGEIVSGLESLVRENPFRERPVGQLMTALYRSGRQADALRAFERHRRGVGEELGIDPSPELRQLEEQILLHDQRLVPDDKRPSRRGLREGVVNPFVGLHAFGEDDQASFFGRESLVADVLRRFERGDRLVSLVGPSGSGKSSVVHAGVIPKVHKEALGVGDEWLVASMVPGAHPFAELEASLLRTRLDGPDSLRGQLASGDQAIIRAGLRMLPDDRARLLLVIDQFEELFTLVDDVGEQRRFLDALLVAMNDPRGRIRVLLTLRADMYNRPLGHAGFGARLGDSIVNVTSLGATELEEAALRPAALAGIQVEPRLLGRLIADVVDRPGALPMFQYSLTELFERRHGDLMVEAAYDEMGGVGGAITNRAERLYVDIGPEEQAAARQLFLRLVSITDGDTWNRRRVRAAEIISLDVDVVALHSVLDTFGAHRLLLFDQDRVDGSPTVEVGHEALLTEWDRLEGWISEARVDLERHAAFLSSLGEWERSGRDTNYLVAGARLAEYERWAGSAAFELNARELEFLGASLERRQVEVFADEERVLREAALAGRARRRLWGMVIFAGALAVVAAGVMFALLGPDPTRVALIHTGDDLMDVGLSEAERRFDIEAARVTPPWTSAEDVQRNLAESGTDLVFMADDLDVSVDPALEYPDTTFVVVFDPSEGITPNYVRYDFAHEQIGYLAGVAAALQSTSRRVGFIGAIEGLPEIWETQAGFEQGARSIDPDIHISPRYLIHGDDVGPASEVWRDPALGYEAAMDLYTDGVDVIFHDAGDAGLGVFSAAREVSLATGVPLWGIGNGPDQYYSVSSPEDSEYVLMSVISRLDTVVLDATERYLAGELKAEEHVLTIASDGIDFVDSGDNLPVRTIDALDRAMSSIRAGELNISRFIDRADSADQTPLHTTDDRFDLAAGGNQLTIVGTLDGIVRFEDDDGQLTGFGVELLREIARRLGLRVDHKDAGWEEMLAQVADGSADLALCFCDITPERQATYAFTPPLLRNQRMLVAAGPTSFTSIDDVQSVAVSRGSAYEELLRSSYPDLEAVYLDGFDAAEAVLRGEVDAMTLDAYAADFYIRVAAEESEVLEIIDTLGEVAVGFPIHPERTELASALNDTITKMIADGTFDEIYDEFFDSDRFRLDR